MLLRFPRTVTALVAAGTAATVLGVFAAPASADQVRGEEWWLKSVNVSDVWPGSQGAGVTVAVLSDGVVRSHQDLTNAVTAAPAINGAPAAAGQFFGEQGTPIASLIAGHGHGSGGSNGVIGVAPKATILSVPVTLPADDPALRQTAVAAAIPNAIAAGIRFAVNHGARVIDLPIDPGQPGSSGLGGVAAAAGGSSAEQQAINLALAHNVIVVAPAGDNAQATDAPNFPAAYPGVIAVGAFDSAFNKSPWTSRQNYVALTGPGVGVVAASSAGGYKMMNSTAAASAVVAGIAALIKSRFPALSVKDVRKALTTTTMFSKSAGNSAGSGSGAVNAAKAFSLAATLATPTSHRAGAGALPAVTSGPAPAGVAVQSLRSQLVRAGEISGAVLVLLLIFVICYAAFGRSRRRRTPSRVPTALAAQWTAGHGQSRYPHAPLTEGDRMLEVFAAPVGIPDSAPGRRELAGNLAPLPASAPRPREDVFTTGRPSREVSQRAERGPAPSQAAASRPVSGTPPWGPAPEPDGDLTWTDAPVREPVAGEAVNTGPNSMPQELENAPLTSSSGRIPRPSQWARGPR
ncbi:MAG: S8 family serine peptidase, partial [Actinobacteria bacterium]|nr:S8 family serine peptidase [Actinomycetota bacterium]